MRTWKLAVATMMLSGILAAQAPVPGTFNNTPPQTTQQTNGSGTNGGYIVSPPTISYGDGITPTVVTNQDTVQVTMPQNTSLNGSSVQASNPATINENAAASNNAATTVVRRPFDFVKAPSGDNSTVGGSMADDSVSLGEVARQMRNGKQIAKRNITNADVDALNAKYPSSNPNGDQSGANGEPMSGNAIASPGSQPNGSSMNNAGGGVAGSSVPAYAQPSVSSPFAPHGSSTSGPDGMKPNAQQGEGIAPRRQSRPAEASPSSNPSQDESNPQQLPRSSSSLPLLGTLGGLSTLVGILYFKLR